MENLIFEILKMAGFIVYARHEHCLTGASPE